MTEPFKRDWLKEALDIARGKNTQIKKEHVLALANAYLIEQGKLQGMSVRLEKVQVIMKKIFENESKQRTEIGLPPLKTPMVSNPPPSLL
jgi:hypothetical protein